MLIGIVGGLIVGITSVGSGSLIIIMLLMLYPRMQPVRAGRHRSGPGGAAGASAALGHLLFGSFKLGLTAAILIGSVPGVFIGARFSSRAPDYLIRPALMMVLLLSGLKLIGMSNRPLAFTMPIAIVLAVAYALSGRRKALRVGAALATAAATSAATMAVTLAAGVGAGAAAATGPGEPDRA